jgi:uncharacterized protein (DUF488 family)
VKAFLKGWQRGKSAMNIWPRLAVFGGRRGPWNCPEPLLAGARFSQLSDYALTEACGAGLGRLRELGSQHRCAIRCAEAVWWRCHRRIITDYLLGEGELVMHILGPSHVDEASLTPGAAVCDGGKILYPAESP